MIGFRMGFNKTRASPITRRLSTMLMYSWLNYFITLLIFFCPMISISYCSTSRSHLCAKILNTGEPLRVFMYRNRMSYCGGSWKVSTSWAFSSYFSNGYLTSTLVTESRSFILIVMLNSSASPGLGVIGGTLMLLLPSAVVRLCLKGDLEASCCMSGVGEVLIPLSYSSYCLAP